MEEDLRGSEESTNRTIWLLLSYMWIAACCAGVFLPAIPLVLERDDEFSKWHAKHGLILALIWFLVTLITLGLANLIGLASDTAKGAIYVLWGIFGAGYLVLCVVALLRAFEGKRWTPKPLEGLLSKLNF